MITRHATYGCIVEPCAGKACFLFSFAGIEPSLMTYCDFDFVIFTVLLFSYLHGLEHIHSNTRLLTNCNEFIYLTWKYGIRLKRKEKNNCPIFTFSQLSPGNLDFVGKRKGISFSRFHLVSFDGIQFSH